MRRFFVVVVILAGLFACSKSKQESLADIQKRKGMPVRVQKVADEEFTKEIYFTAGLKGYKQTSEFSPISAEVSGIEARVGQKVKKNQVVIRFPDDKPSANYLQAKSAYDNSEKIYRRMKKIFAKGGISKQEMDNVATQYKVDKANFESASKLVAITSPISGVMTAINVSLTDNISQGDFLFTVSDLSKLKAKLQASEAQIVQMREGQKVRAVWNDITLLGELTEMSMSKDPVSQSFICFAEFDNSDLRVLSGALADVFVRVVDLPNQKVVPSKIIQKEAGKSYVFVVENGVAKKRFVKVENQNQTQSCVSGIVSGEQVIIDGYSTVYDGCKVNITQ